MTKRYAFDVDNLTLNDVSLLCSNETTDITDKIKLLIRICDQDIADEPYMNIALVMDDLSSAIRKKVEQWR